VPIRDGEADPFDRPVLRTRSPGAANEKPLGASALLKELQTKYGFTPGAVVGIAKARLAASAGG